ncbi:MAG: hypothetical protein QT11_C0001G0255 [archaeon GW2011_AR20]|nr:MAG: hypothetical protein QT11_C0001G0255 [archaeon GW2011_AR20]AQS28425.1 hypothetical protein [uncultured archaeon]MBS3160262.1 hypothetical protein [Candidatus Woesearchaeota archaeon]
MNKKAQFETSHELIIWIPRIIALVIVAGIVFFLITLPVKQSFEIDKLQETILRQRFLYSENCLAHNDGKVNSGIIDKSKFNQKNLDKCFEANDKIGVNLNLITDKIETINLNQKIAEKLDFCFDKKHFTCTNYTYYVLIQDEKKLESGLLNVAMIKIK